MDIRSAGLFQVERYDLIIGVVDYLLLLLISEGGRVGEYSGKGKEGREDLPLFVNKRTVSDNSDYIADFTYVLD